MRGQKEIKLLDAVAIIPARYGSTRLPGKPILEEARQVTGKYIIQHVYERVSSASAITRAIVATDDERILRAVEDFGGEARMTAACHRSGTDRIAEVAAGLREEIIVNVQGDEPEILPEQVDQVTRLLQEDPEASMGTLAHPIDSEADWRDPNAVKVVLDHRGYALYFSRSPIPFVRDSSDWIKDSPARPLRHLGIYSYRREFLLSYGALPPSELEESEKLEQLRALAAGYRIKVAITPHAITGIDTREDLERWLALCGASGAAGSQ